MSNVIPFQGQPNPNGKPAIERPDAINTNWISEADAKADAGVGGVRSFLEHFNEVVDRVDAMRTHPDKRRTIYANDEALCEFVSDGTKQLYDRGKSARLRLEESRHEAEGALERARALKDADGPWAPFIAAAFAKMKDAQRMAEAEAAIERGDRRTLSALLKGPHFASGLTLAQQEALQIRFDAKFAAAETAKLASVAHAEKRLQAALAQILPTMTRGYAGTEKQADAEQMLKQILAARELAPGMVA